MLAGMAILFSAHTDVGRVREQNEDNYLVDRKLQLYLVCDGMGGHLSGEVASATAVNVVREQLVMREELLNSYIETPTEEVGATIAQPRKSALRFSGSSVRPA